MTQQTVNILLVCLAAAGSLFTLSGIYYVFVALLGLKKVKEPSASAPTTRFAVVTAARNEAAVIGQLVDSLRAQNYPDALYQIIVAPNNCTDDTAAVARRHGAGIFEPEGEVRSKGEVLRQLMDRLMKDESYDAVCIIDADNLVHPEFLQRMNDAYNAGEKAVQGMRDTKNLTASAVSTCYSVNYWMLNRFYNAGRETLGLSCLANGSGFMVSMELMRRLGGWQTKTLTEDYEFTAQAVLAGYRVAYLPSAVIYDEQPLTFIQSWKQRRRWSSGSVQGMWLYSVPLIRAAAARRSMTCFDLLITVATPLTKFVSLIFSACSVLLTLYAIFFLGTQALGMWLLTVAGGAALAFVGCAVLAAFLVWLNRRGQVKNALPGVLFYAIFLLSWLPISLISLFKQKKTWDPIAHTCVSTVEDMPDTAPAAAKGKKVPAKPAGVHVWTL